MISVVILTKNEEKNIIPCIQSVEWCDEIIIIDDYSDDKTIELLGKKNNRIIKIFRHHLANDFAAQRNFGLSKCNGDWVLFIDADERVTTSLQFEIINTISTSLDHVAGYYLQRSDSMWGRTLKYGEIKNIRFIRLGRKNAGTWKRKVHEIWDINGKTAVLQNPLLHFPHKDTAEFLQEINYYTDLRSQELFDQQVKTNILLIIGYPAGKFIRSYFLRFGILDGLPGFIFALLMSFHSFLVRAKLWQQWNKKKITRPVVPDR